MTDTQLLDFLQSMLDQRRYTGRAIMRWSFVERGIRLHETSLEGAVPDVRQAIRNFMREETGHEMD